MQIRLKSEKNFREFEMFKKILENLTMAKAKKTTKKSSKKTTKKSAASKDSKAKKPAKKAAAKPVKKVTKTTTKKVAKKAPAKSAGKSASKSTKKISKKTESKSKNVVAKKVEKKLKKQEAKLVVKSKKAPKNDVEKVTPKKNVSNVAKKEEVVTQSLYEEVVDLDKEIESKINLTETEKLKEDFAEEVLLLSEDFKLNDIFETIRDISFFQNYSDECMERSCDSPSSTKGFCRLHYISNWKNLKKREAILIDGKLQEFIEDLAKKYPLKNIELVLNDLSDEKSFFAALNEMDIESIDDDQDQLVDDGVDDDDQDIAFETKTTKSGYYED